MTIVIIVCGLIAALIIVACMACCKVSGDCTRQEEQEDPCLLCLRWPECNGVDEDCPLRNDHD